MRAAVAATLVLLTASASSARTWYITPDGTGDAPTIQAGVDSAAAGDTVEVACGTYYDCVHQDSYAIFNCMILKSGITLRSQTGDPNCVIVDAQQQGRVANCTDVDGSTVIEGITFRGGLNNAGGPGGSGGGLFLLRSSLVIRNCRVVENSSRSAGGILCRYFSGRLSGCVVADNFAEYYGGGIFASSTDDAVFENCRISDNTAERGGGVYLATTTPAFMHTGFSGNLAILGGAVYGSFAMASFANCSFVANSATNNGSVLYYHGNGPVSRVTNSIIAFNLGVPPVQCGYPVLEFLCSDVYGNEGGDWVCYLPDLFEIGDNFSADPLFCDPDNGDLTLHADSPCLPGNHPEGADCGLIGAFGQGCGPVSVEPETWAGIKARYRDGGR